MKSYYWKNIWNQIIKLKTETFVIFSISFAICFFMSILYFFGFSQKMETAIANSIDMKIELKNNFLFNTEKYSNFDILHNTPNIDGYWNEFIDFLEEMNEVDYFEYSNYNINISASYFSDNHQDLSYNRLFGISDEKFLMKNEIVLSEGRNFTQEEIDKAFPYLIVSDQSTIIENAQNRKIKIGDHVNVLLNDSSNSISMEVIGIYKSNYKDIIVSGQNNSFTNSKGMLTSNHLMKDYIVAEHIPIENVSINKITYSVSDYSYFKEAQDLVEEKFMNFQKKMNNLNFPKLNIELMDNSTMSILSSITHIKTIYKFIFIIAVLLISVLFTLTVHYFLNQKVKEIGVYVSFGQSKIKIIGHYLLAYLFIAVCAGCFAIVVGYLVSQLLNQAMLHENLQLQNDFLRYFDSNSWNKEITVHQLSPEYTFNLISIVYIFLELIGIVSVSIFFSMIHLIKKHFLRKDDSK